MSRVRRWERALMRWCELCSLSYCSRLISHNPSECRVAYVIAVWNFAMRLDLRAWRRLMLGPWSRITLRIIEGSLLSSRWVEHLIRPREMCLMWRFVVLALPNRKQSRAIKLNAQFSVTRFCDLHGHNGRVSVRFFES